MSDASVAWLIRPTELPGCWNPLDAVKACEYGADTQCTPALCHGNPNFKHCTKKYCLANPESKGCKLNADEKCLYEKVCTYATCKDHFDNGQYPKCLDCTSKPSEIQCWDPKDRTSQCQYGAKGKAYCDSTICKGHIAAAAVDGHWKNCDAPPPAVTPGYSPINVPSG